MANNAFRSAWKRESLNRANFLQCLALVTLVSSLLLLAACSLLGNPFGSSTSQSSTTSNLAISGAMPAAVMGVSYNTTF